MLDVSIPPNLFGSPSQYCKTKACIDRVILPKWIGKSLAIAISVYGSHWGFGDMRTFALLALATLGAFGCRGTQGGSPSQPTEAFDSQEFAVFFQSRPGNVTKYEELPKATVLNGKGWPAHYWPSFRWGLLWRYFDQSQSPLEKFEKAFQTELKAENPHYRSGDLERLERRRVSGVTTNWFGICDGSSEASLNFSEPLSVVKIDETIFYPFEVKALLSYFTAMSSPQRKLLFAGRRVSFDNPRFDAEGRGVDTRYRDINPGLFHLALGNYIGIGRRGLVADIMPDSTVLNFPIIGYEVRSSSVVLDEGDLQRFRAFNPDAAQFVVVQTVVNFGESHRVMEPFPESDHTMRKAYNYVLELDGSGQIIGGEWLADSVQDHPDFLWLARDGELKVEDFATSRLGRRIAVGQPLKTLLTSPAVGDSDGQVGALLRHPDALAGFKIFFQGGQTQLPPPEDPIVRQALER